MRFVQHFPNPRGQWPVLFAACLTGWTFANVWYKHRVEDR